jgi:hypothetical protein
MWESPATSALPADFLPEADRRLRAEIQDHQPAQAEPFKTSVSRTTNRYWESESFELFKQALVMCKGIEAI